MKRTAMQLLHDLRGWISQLLFIGVMLFLGYLLYGSVLGYYDSDIPTNRLILDISFIFAISILPEINRLVEIRVSKSGFSAKLTQKKIDLLNEIAYVTEDEEIVKETQKLILTASKEEELTNAIRDARKLNVIRNVQTIKDAIKEKKKLEIKYRPITEFESKHYFVIPLDLKPGDTSNTSELDYLLLFSETDNTPKTFRVDNIINVSKSEETFDPDSIENLKNILQVPNIERNW